tara:strand:- start:609 stop:1103 length:495 start_codon:yes stop_codon:yes gene_type:complete
MEQKTSKKDNKSIKKVGRKRINIDLEQVENLASRGLGTTQIARALGVSWNTIDRNRKRLGEFEDALKRGKARGLAQVTNSLFTSANDGNVTAQIFYLKNQDPKTWKDRVESVHATINLNDVLNGAKTRIGNYTATERQPKIINAVDTSSQGGEHLVSKKMHKKK